MNSFVFFAMLSLLKDKTYLMKSPLAKYLVHAFQSGFEFIFSSKMRTDSIAIFTLSGGFFIALSSSNCLLSIESTLFWAATNAGSA